VNTGEERFQPINHQKERMKERFTKISLRIISEWMEDSKRTPEQIEMEEEVIEKTLKLYNS